MFSGCTLSDHDFVCLFVCLSRCADYRDVGIKFLPIDHRAKSHAKVYTSTVCCRVFACRVLYVSVSVCVYVLLYVCMCAARKPEFVKSVNATVVEGHSVMLHCVSERAFAGHVIKWMKNGDGRSLSESVRFQVCVMRVDCRHV